MKPETGINGSHHAARVETALQTENSHADHSISEKLSIFSVSFLRRSQPVSKTCLIGTVSGSVVGGLLSSFNGRPLMGAILGGVLGGSLGFTFGERSGEVVLAEPLIEKVRQEMIENRLVCFFNLCKQLDFEKTRLGNLRIFSPKVSNRNNHPEVAGS